MTRLLNGLDEQGTTTGNDQTMAKIMAETLVDAYRADGAGNAHLWAVSFDSATGLAIIRNLLLSGEYGYVLKIPDIFSASSFIADVKRAGGEILERYRLGRGRFDQAQYAALKPNFAGHFEFDR
jgi:hypothetical protein